MPECQPFEK